MKGIFFLTALILSLNSCNMADSRYPPEEYFDGHDLSIARAIYANDRSALKIFVQEPGFDVNKIGKQGISFLLYAIYAEQKKWLNFY